jgi:glycosyltransferase involved in cell wall biosynthesis
MSPPANEATDRLKVYYHASTYRSHNRCAADYRRAIASRHLLVDEAGDCDVAILHIEPQQIAKSVATLRLTRGQPVVAMAVWEAESLPVSHQAGIDCVDEVWVPSEFCAQVFRKYHPRVFRVPHVVARDLRVDPAARERLRGILAGSGGSFFYLAIAGSKVARKNVGALLAAFSGVSAELPQARLILAGASMPELAARRDVITLSRRADDAEINCLYDLADVVVSAHHAEGWGLTLSDGMLFGKLTVAPRYSGNLEFMHDGNSLLVATERAPVAGKAEELEWFLPTMIWGEPDAHDLAAKLLLAHRLVRSGGAEPLVARARLDLAAFSPEAVAALLDERLHDAVCHAGAR